MPARKRRRRRATRKRQTGGAGGFALAKGLTSLAGRIVKDKGAKQALSESLGTKLKRAWANVSGKTGKKIEREMKKKGYVKMKNYKRGDLRRKLCEQNNWKNWATGPHKEHWRCSYFT